MAAVSLNISVIPERLYVISGPAGTDAYYSNKKVLGAGADNYFIANETTTLIVYTASVSSGAITIKEIQRSYYNAYDGQGGVWCYQPGLDKWTSVYSFRPEWFSMVGNRLLTFKDGMPYVHNSETFNQFYGWSYDSVVSLVHNDAGNIVKSYTNVSIEGDIPDLFHCRTESPNIQSTDIRYSDFETKEGVKYSAILRDRLSPSKNGSYEQKLFTGDRIKGDVGLFQSVFFTPATNKFIKFVNIVFNPSRGHSTQNEE